MQLIDLITSRPIYISAVVPPIDANPVTSCLVPGNLLTRTFIAPSTFKLNPGSEHHSTLLLSGTR
jgi:hypothetical protein